ncbi:MAG: hydroxyacid dehydrogenase [Acidobacteria bacterium]|nr:hydroxyacid dehydrogenase [Acidobacteriota bacterium]
MKVLVADTFEASGLDGLKAAGCEVVYEPELSADTLTASIGSTGADVLVVRSTKVTEPMLDAGRLSLIVRAGAGVNTIDVGAASRRGIYVSNCPGKNAIAVAELAFGLILALDRRIPDNVVELRAGRWSKKEYSSARGLFGRTLGLLGFGPIGQEMARRANGFGMPVLVWSPRFLRKGSNALADVPGDLTISVVDSPQDLAASSDILSVHLALTSDTRGFVGADIVNRMKPRSILVNTARGELIDHAAVAAAVRARGLRVGIDVFPDEPAASAGPYSAPLVDLPNVYGTHHIGASTDQAQQAIAAEAVRVIRAYRDTGAVPNVVNLTTHTPATHMLIVRHRDRPGVLAHVFEHLRAGNLNVQETENVIFDGAEAAVARINLDGHPPAALLRAIEQGNQDILSLHVVNIQEQQ